MAFEQLKERQSVVWGSAPFENVAADIAEVHDHLVAELAFQPPMPEGGGSPLEWGREEYLGDLLDRTDGGIEAPRQYLLILGTRR